MSDRLGAVGDKAEFGVSQPSTATIFVLSLTAKAIAVCIHSMQPIFIVIIICYAKQKPRIVS